MHYKFLLCVVYRPPKVVFFSDLEDVLFRYTPLYSEVVILGDFNCDFNGNSPDRIYLNNLFSSFSLTVLPLNSSLFTSTSNSWIDLIIVRGPENDRVSSFGQFPVPFLSAHDLIYVYLNISTPEFAPRQIRYHDLKNLKGEAFLIFIISLL